MGEVCFPLHHLFQVIIIIVIIIIVIIIIIMASSRAGSRQLRSTHYVICFLPFGRLFPPLLLSTLTLLCISQGFADPVGIPGTSTAIVGRGGDPRVRGGPSVQVITKEADEARFFWGPSVLNSRKTDWRCSRWETQAWTPSIWYWELF